jgi:hypothetical protein
VILGLGAACRVEEMRDPLDLAQGEPERLGQIASPSIQVGSGRFVEAQRATVQDEPIEARERIGLLRGDESHSTQHLASLITGQGFLGDQGSKASHGVRCRRYRAQEPRTLCPQQIMLHRASLCQALNSRQKLYADALNSRPTPDESANLPTGSR